MTERKSMIQAKPGLSVTRQCQLLAVPRSSAYTRLQEALPADLDVMRQLDELHLKWPFYGSRRLLCGAATPGVSGKSEAYSTVDAQDGAPSDLPKAANQSTRKRAQDISLLTERPKD